MELENDETLEKNEERKIGKKNWETLNLDFDRGYEWQGALMFNADGLQ